MRLLSGQRKQRDTVNSMKTQRQQHVTPVFIDFFKTVKTSIAVCFFKSLKINRIIKLLNPQWCQQDVKEVMKN